MVTKTTAAEETLKLLNDMASKAGLSAADFLRTATSSGNLGGADHVVQKPVKPLKTKAPSHEAMQTQARSTAQSHAQRHET
jgi:hypothetical protein